MIPFTFEVFRELTMSARISSPPHRMDSSKSQLSETERGRQRQSEIERDRGTEAERCRDRKLRLVSDIFTYFSHYLNIRKRLTRLYQLAFFRPDSWHMDQHLLPPTISPVSIDQQERRLSSSSIWSKQLQHCNGKKIIHISQYTTTSFD